MARTPKGTVTKTTDIVIKDEGVTEIVDPKPVKKVGRPKAQLKQSLSFTVFTSSGPVELTFENQSDLIHAFQQITFKCASGRQATVSSGGKEYTFCKVDYLVRDDSKSR
jgi:hypothetical protein